MRHRNFVVLCDVDMSYCSISNIVNFTQPDGSFIANKLKSYPVTLQRDSLHMGFDVYVPF